MVAYTLMVGTEIVVGPAGLQRGTARLEGMRSWRWMSGFGCLSGDLGQLIPTSTAAALR
jgi:hypothetical protein